MDWCLGSDKHTIINNGEANIEMREAQLKSPTNIRLIALSSICKLPTSMITNMPKTAKSNSSILTYQMTVYSTQQLKKINQFFIFIFCIYHSQDSNSSSKD